MSKQPILKETRENTAKTFQTPDLPSGDAKPDLRPVIECEKASRVSRSRPLDVLEYQPCERDSARPLLSGWHLLFFARTGTTHIQDLRAALQQESERDEQLMQRFKRIQAQYRQHAARESQSMAERVTSQPVIAEIRYGGLSVVPGFWLPEDMEMGLSLLPRTGARLQLSALTLVEHLRPKSLQSLEVLMVAAPVSRTKAETASEHFMPLDTSYQEKRVFTLSTPVGFILTVGYGVITVTAAGAADAGDAGGDGGGNFEYVSGGVYPSTRWPEELRQQQAERVRHLGEAPSVSRLIEARQQLFVGEKTR